MDIAALQARTDEQVGQARTLALAGTVGEDPAWDAYLVSLELDVPLPERRKDILAAGMPQEKGVLPAEFRQVLTVIHERTRAELRRLPKPESDEAEEARERLLAHLETLVENEMQRYLQDVRPPVSAFSIFANAMQTTARSREVADTVNTKTCPTCSAARLKEMDQGCCAYCGYDYRLFPNR